MVKEYKFGGGRNGLEEEEYFEVVSFHRDRFRGDRFQGKFFRAIVRRVFLLELQFMGM